jgi:hypothetical protein
MRITLTFVFLLIISFTSNSADVEKIKPFTSDGCSIFPDGTLEHKNLWLACCTAHDYAYWQGGTAKQKQDADNALKQCVAKVGQPEIAELMLAGVKVGGNPYLPTPFRWGYGWPYPQEYKALTDEQKQQVEAADPFKDSNQNNN